MMQECPSLAAHSLPLPYGGLQEAWGQPWCMRSRPGLRLDLPCAETERRLSAGGIRRLKGGAGEGAWT